MVAPDDELTARIDLDLTRDQAATILADPLATLRPSQGKLGTAEERALMALYELVTDQARGRAYEDFEETLGHGAMGVVRVATQPGMGRKVAVKTLKQDHRDRGSILRLLQEAWITGSLEHPNIVPVYEIAVDRDKSPQVVLKQIRGMHWRDLIRDPEEVKKTLGEGDLFEWNLRTLMQVCSAVHFAHSRGIVHRDVKPENIMIGPFGEVYVMDWGIAVSTREEDEGRIPVAWDITEMAGTPGYMAPEMLDGEEPYVSARTDVYLLGATLFEIIAGRAPHRGASLMELVKSIVRSAPEFPTDAPPPLVAICKKAMHADPSRRYPSAEDLRLALQDFLRHKSSARLCYEASLRLSEYEAQLLTFHEDLPDELVAELEERVAESTLDGPPPQDRPKRARIYDLFGACRFGFQQALEEGPDNRVARQGLERVVFLMAQFELSQGNLSAAELLAMELDRPPKALRRLLRKHQREEEKRLGAIEQIRRDHDRTIGTRTRALLALVLGLAWTFTPFMAEVLNPEGKRMLLTTSLWTGVFLGFGGALAIWTRRAMTASALNRGLLGTIFLTLFAHLVVNLGIHLSDVPPIISQLLKFLIWFLATAMVAIVLERRLWPAAVGYMLGFLIACAWPQRLYLVMSLCNLTFTLNAWFIWWPREESLAARLEVTARRMRPRPDK